MPLNKLHQLAIELKYEGLDYATISQRLNGRFTESTLKGYFRVEGLLYDAYLTYESVQNKARIDSVQGIFEKHVATAAEIIATAMITAKANGKTSKAIEYAEKILDRAGIVVKRKVQIKDDREEKLTDEDLARELRREGLDPETGLIARVTKKK